MPGQKQRTTFGRYYQDDQGNRQPGFAYAGSSSGENEGMLEAGIGVYDGEQFDFLNANAQFGGIGQENGGTQFGLKAEATSIGMQGGLLGDLASLVGIETNGQSQGGWENFFGYEVHGPQAKAEANVGTEGLQVGAGVDWLGGTGKIGGAKYDWFGGTEISIGAGIAATPGASGGLHWSDDDGDGVREYGLNVGGKLAAGLGLGADVGIKTEIPGHLYNLGAAGVDWAGEQLSNGADWAGEQWNAGTDWAGDQWNSGTDWIGEQWNAGTDWAGEQLSNGADWAGEQWNAGTDWAGEQWNAGTDWVGEQWDSATNWAGEAIDTGTEWAGDAWDSASSWAGDTANQAGEAISSGWDTVTGGVSDAGSAIASFFGW